MDEDKLTLKTHIEVHERSLYCEVDSLIGAMAKKRPLGSILLEDYLAQYQLDRLSFVKISDPAFLDRRLTFIGSQGFEAAKTILGKSTDDRILLGLNSCLLGGGTLQKFILRMCLHDPLTGRWMCVQQTDPLELFAPPPRWVFDSEAFAFSRRFDEGEDGITYCIYLPSGEKLLSSEGN